MKASVKHARTFPRIHAHSGNKGPNEFGFTLLFLFTQTGLTHGRILTFDVESLQDI